MYDMSLGAPNWGFRMVFATVGLDSSTSTYGWSWLSGANGSTKIRNKQKVDLAFSESTKQFSSVQYSEAFQKFLPPLS